MPQLVSDTFNVAWFKLAEFVQRKEKERALAIYRLLVHAVLDPALTLQLEADLLRAFKDDKAIDMYKRAALLYEQSERALEAVLVYEQIAKLTNLTYELAEKMLELYQKISYETQAARCAAHMVRLLLEQRDHEKIDQFFEKLTIKQPYRAQIAESYVLTLLQHEAYTGQYLLERQLTTVIEGYLTDPEQKKMSLFLSNLAALDVDAFRHAQTLLQS